MSEENVSKIETSGLFDYRFYSIASGLGGSRTDLIRHYLDEGATAGLRPSPVFDPEFYRRQYGHALSDLEPFVDYVMTGRTLARYPSEAVLLNDIHRVATSNLFDGDYYRLKTGLPPDVNAIRHYLLSDIATSQRPNSAFDPLFYCTYYPDWVRRHHPFVDFVLDRRKSWVFRNAAEAARVVDVVRASEYFDEAYYRERHMAGLDHLDAATHFCTLGFRRLYRPSQRFDPAYYLNVYHDIREARVNPLWHYEVSGRSENRVVFADIPTVLSAGRRAFDPDRPTILVGCHDSGRTGAPILGLNLVALLSRTYNVFSWLGRDGDLRDDFADYSYLVAVLDPSVANASSITENILRAQNLSFAILNSVEATTLAPSLWRADVPIVSLVHEFAQYTRPRGKLGRALMLSDRVIVPAEVVRESARKDLESLLVSVDLPNVTVRPQGRSIVGMGAPLADDVTREALFAAMGVDPDAPAAERPFVVFGAGWVQPRKGVEYFVAVARRLQQQFDRPFRFVWVGGNYRPREDLNYAVWLADEIERSGLADMLLLFEEQGSLDVFWDAADAFLLTSRLDPFPNVVLDAIAHEVPVVCFDRATGVAEHAGEPGLGIEKVPYLDIPAAADALARIARGDGPAIAPSPAKDNLLDLRSYAEAVVAAGEEARERVALRVAEERQIAESGLFDNGSFAAACPRWLGDHILPPFFPEATLLKLYVTLGHRRVYLAKSRNGFNDAVYAASTGLTEGAALALAARLGDDATTHATIEPRAAGTAEGEPAVSTALHIHLHYPELGEAILHQLRATDCDADLFISTTSADKADLLRATFASYAGGRVDILEVPNRGRDIGAFLSAWPGRWANYDVVGHIHGKKSAGLGSSRGDEWRDFIFERLLGTPRTYRTIMAAFADDERLGLVFPEDPNIVGWTENREPARALLERIGVAADLPEAIEFPLGTMFWARPAALAPLLDAGFTFDDYPPEPLAYDGTLLHAIERLLPMICTASGLAWKTVSLPGD